MAGMGMGFIGAALSGLSMVAQGAAEARATQHEGDKAEISSRVSALQGTQLDTAYRAELGTTLSAIRAVRASAGASVDSPSARAFEAGERRESDRQRRIDVGSRRMQSAVSASDATYFRGAAKTAFGLGIFRGLTAFASGAMR